MFTSIKGYFYAGLAAALLIGFLWYRHHERAAGAAEALVPVKVLAQKAQVQVAQAAVTAQAAESLIDVDYIKATAGPAPKSLGIVCHRDSGSGVVPQTSPSIPTPAGSSAPDSGSGPGYDPSGAALERARKADAEIKYLQGRVHELEQQMVNSP